MNAKCGALKIQRIPNNARADINCNIFGVNVISLIVANWAYSSKRWPQTNIRSLHRFLYFKSSLERLNIEGTKSPQHDREETFSLYWSSCLSLCLHG